MQRTWALLERTARSTENESCAVTARMPGTLLAEMATPRPAVSHGRETGGGEERGLEGPEGLEGPGGSWRELEGAGRGRDGAGERCR
jgi:hypothetical protein